MKPNGDSGAAAGLGAAAGAVAAGPGRGARTGAPAILAAAALALASASCLASCSRAASAAGGAAPPADLVVYSSHSEELARVVVSEFRGRTGLRVKLVIGGTVELLQRLRDESVEAKRRGSAEACDVLWGGGAETLSANSELFERYASPEAAAIPDSYKAADGAWTGFTILPMAICYNTRLLAADRAPKSWKELLEPRFKGAIAYANPRVSASSYTILRTIGLAVSAATGASLDSVEAAFVANLDGKLLPESKDVFPAVASGEFLVGLYLDQGALEYAVPGSDLRIVYPKDGTSAAPDGVALARASRHGRDARRFIDFVLGRDVALIMSSRFQRRSVRVDSPPPPGQPPLSAIRLVPYDIAQAAREKESTLARFSSWFDRTSPP